MWQVAPWAQLVAPFQFDPPHCSNGAAAPDEPEPEPAPAPAPEVLEGETGAAVEETGAGAVGAVTDMRVEDWRVVGPALEMEGTVGAAAEDLAPAPAPAPAAAVVVAAPVLAPAAPVAAALPPPPAVAEPVDVIAEVF